MPRSKSSQSKHDAKVRELAKKLKQQGFDVNADVSGYAKPKTLGGYRPDIIATKENQRKILEVETPDSVDSSRDLKQQAAFKRIAQQSKNTVYRREIA